MADKNSGKRHTAHIGKPSADPQKLKRDRGQGSPSEFRKYPDTRPSVQFHLHAFFGAGKGESPHITGLDTGAAEGTCISDHGLSFDYRYRAESALILTDPAAYTKVLIYV
jgi:hypothetical protein